MIRRFVLWSVAVATFGAALVSPADAAAENVTLAWDASTSSGITAYYLYVGTSPGTYTQTLNVGLRTTYTYTQAAAGRRYYFAVAAVAGAAVGLKSNEIDYVTSGTLQTGGSTPPVGSGPSVGSTPPAGSSTPPTVSAPPAGGSTSRGSTSTPPPTTTPAATEPVTTAPSTSGIVLNTPVITGGVVALAWNAVGRVNVREYLLEAGSASGLSNLYNASVGHQRNVSARISPGSYFVRVRARLADGTFATSNEVSFSSGQPGTDVSNANSAPATGQSSTGCTAPPAPPTDVTGAVMNGRANLQWTPSAGATTYVVQAGSTEGFSDVYHGNVGPSTSVAADVAPGFRAHVRVIAVNACGQSAASVEMLLQ
jgi:hypothetical protein